ncbi:hypothetical protein [Pedobacter deserti]|uniref:hypothetical protein n=1 Tax=Pedobacter deserti TaxID=2817382 RepID=UPI00210C34CD|nr:hypothetical protein [Pedobacter sp. SYSU D00382]
MNLHKIFFFFVPLILIVTLSACEKGVIAVKSDKIYRERLEPLPGGWGSLAMSIELKPNGKATLIEEGDMASEGTYKIKGDKLIMKNYSYTEPLTFKIISEEEIHSPSGKKLYLAER